MSEAESPKAGSPKAGSSKAGSSKAESPKAGSSKAESSKAGSPKAGSSKAGSSKAESSKAGSSKAESSKAGSSKAGSSKAGWSKAGSSKAGSPTKYWSIADESVVREIQYMDSIPEGVVEKRRSPFGMVKIACMYCTPQEVDEFKKRTKQYVGDQSKLIAIYYDVSNGNISDPDVTYCVVGAILNKEALEKTEIENALTEVLGYAIMEFPDMNEVYSYSCKNKEGAVQEGYDKIETFLRESEDVSDDVGPFMTVFKKDLILMLKPLDNRTEYYLEEDDRKDQEEEIITSL